MDDWFHVLPLVLGFLLDQVVGDPPTWPHPVQLIGRLLQFLEPVLRCIFPERLGGACLALLTVGATAGVTSLTLLIDPLWLQLLAETLLVYYGLAARSLAVETRAVLAACSSSDLAEARRRLSRIVGRDTADLPPESIFRACIETVAENASDGVVAPLFYAALAGPVGLWAYKAINTLDSMVGYRNPRYERFGWASARLDDLANWLPARLTYLLIALASAATIRNTLRIGWRDGGKHPSPNAGWPESAMAGALGVQLGGPSSYGGIVSNKPHLGEPLQPLNENQAQQAIRIMLRVSWLMIVLAVAARGLIIYLLR